MDIALELGGRELYCNYLRKVPNKKRSWLTNQRQGQGVPRNNGQCSSKCCYGLGAGPRSVTD
jgi:hypothetical protein